MQESYRLDGQTILVIEDDYLLAYDTAEALEQAGAKVIGPFADEVYAGIAISDENITVALTDLNLGRGISFKAATVLREAGVPFAFLTGYDQSVIPEEFRDVPRFAKPIDTRRIAQLICDMLRKPATRSSQTTTR